MKRYFLTVIFILIIFCPIVVTTLGINVGKSNSENRALQTKPEFTLTSTLNSGNIFQGCFGFYKDVIGYKNNFNEYYKDNFVFKPILFRPFNFIKLRIFKVNPLPEKVVNGNDGWMFLGDSYSDVIMESKGFLTFSKQELDVIEENLMTQKKWLDSLNIKYYVSVAPNKLNIYGDYLPVMKSENPTKLEQLKEKLSETAVKFVDLSELYDIHNSPYLYFFKTNTHWNDMGAFYGYKALITEIQGDFPMITPLNFEDLSVSDYLSYQEDLTKMLDINVEEKNITLKVKENTAKQVENILIVPKTIYLSSSDYEMRFKSSANNLKILVFRDSFGTALMQFFAENFGESLFIWDHYFNKDLILSEKPDIVIHEIVERDIEQLAD